MNKNNRKLKIIYKCIKAVPYDSMLYTPPTKILISKPHQKGGVGVEAIQKSLPFGKWSFREREFRRMGQKQKRIRQKEQQD